MREMRENCIIHRRSHLEPKKSIYYWIEFCDKYGIILIMFYLWLQEAAFEEYKGLIFVFVDEFS